MEPEKWFDRFIHQYRALVDSRYSDRKNIFPFYSPVDITIYLIEDSKNIFPSVVAFFDAGYSEEWIAQDFRFTKKITITWEKNPTNYDPPEDDYIINDKWYETFYDEINAPGSMTNIAFASDVFDSNPKDIAQVYVQKHLIHDRQRQSFENFLKLSQVRLSVMGKDQLDKLLSDLTRFKGMPDEEKAGILSLAFWLMGFETVNVERIMKLPEFSILKNRPHIDVIAILLSEKLLIAIEEGEMNKDRWYKLDSVKTTLDALKFLGEKEDWTTVFLAIGGKSKGIAYLERKIQVVSLDYFRRTLEEFINGRTWAPSINAIRKVVGYDLDFFRIKT